MDVRNGTLHDYLRNHPGERTLPRCVELLCDILHGVSAIHFIGLVHRDLHLENVLMKARTPPRSPTESCQQADCESLRFP